jgi:hypothetical protein
MAASEKTDRLLWVDSGLSRSFDNVSAPSRLRTLPLTDSTASSLNHDGSPARHADVAKLVVLRSA